MKLYKEICWFNFAPMFIYACLYVIPILFFNLVFYSLSMTSGLVLLTTFFQEAMTAAATRFQGVKVQQNAETAPCSGMYLHVQAGYCK